MKFSEMRDFVLTPGARFYKTMCSSGFCTSPEELADFLFLEYGVDKQKILDFLYDKAEVDRNFVRMIFEAYGLKEEAARLCGLYWERYYDYQRMMENNSCLILGIRDLENIEWSDDDIDNLLSEMKKYEETIKSDVKKVEKIRSLLLEARAIFQSMRNWDNKWLQEQEDKEEELGNRVELANALLQQRIIDKNEDRSCGGDKSPSAQKVKQVGDEVKHIAATEANVYGLHELYHDTVADILDKLSEEMHNHSLGTSIGLLAKFGSRVGAKLLPWFFV